MKTLSGLWLGLALAGAAAAAAAPEPLPRKLIVTGWDNPDTAQFRRDLQRMEQSPFDGAVIFAMGRGSDGQPFDAKMAFATNHWEPDCFAGALADLQAARSDKLTDNFLMFGANPGNVDWFDEAGWAEIREHCRLLARLAHQGGMKGILFDPEPYTEPFRPFKYGAPPGGTARAYAQCCQQARQRGRQMMDAIATEFPGVVLYTYFLYSQCSRALPGGSSRAALSSLSYGLLPAFADGWLDRLPPDATLIDGNESAYRYNSDAVFDAAFVRIKVASRILVAPENRSKFRAQLDVSHGLYLDAYVNPPGSSYFIDGLGGPRVRRLERNAAAALNASDGYVWVYGEHARWWPPPSAEAKAPQTWPEVLPGIESALLDAKDPARAAQPKPNESAPGMK